MHKALATFWLTMLGWKCEYILRGNYSWAAKWTHPALPGVEYIYSY